MNSVWHALTMVYIFSGAPVPGSAPGEELSSAFRSVAIWYLLAFVVATLGSLLLLVGAILLLSRVNAGRHLTITGALLLVGVEVVQTFVMALAPNVAISPLGLGFGFVSFVFLLWKFALPTAAAILAALPSTAVWLAAKAPVSTLVP